MRKILICTGDVSGEKYAVKLIQHFKTSNKNIQIDCVGSDRLKSVGANPIACISHKSTIGLIEPIKNLRLYLRELKKVSHYLESTKINLVLCIDAQGFNIQILKKAKSLKIQTAYFIAPQEWQWGSIEGGKNCRFMRHHLYHFQKRR